MIKTVVSGFIVRLLGKVYQKLYLMGVFVIPKEAVRKNTDLVNLFLGKNCSVDPTAILVCHKNGMIELEGDNYIGRNVELGTTGGKIFIGYNTSIQDRCVISGDVEIGRNCLFSLNILIDSGRHYYGLKPEFYIKDQDIISQNDKKIHKNHLKKVIIEDDCWLGYNVAIMPGVKIGKGSVIGANAVVTKDVEPYSIMAGVPAVLIKKRLYFELKESIHFLKDQDLPYFYNGFYTDIAHLEESRKIGGIQGMSIFSVYLKSEGKINIILRIRKIENNILKIKYHSQIKEISYGEFSDVIFNIEHISIHKFVLISNFENNNKSHSLKDIVFVESVKTV